MKPTIKFNGHKWVLRFQAADGRHIAWAFSCHSGAIATLRLMYRADGVSWRQNTVA